MRMLSDMLFLVVKSEKEHENVVRHVILGCKE